LSKYATFDHLSEVDAIIRDLGWKWEESHLFNFRSLSGTGVIFERRCVQIRSRRRPLESLTRCIYAFRVESGEIAIVHRSKGSPPVFTCFELDFPLPKSGAARIALADTLSDGYRKVFESGGGLYGAGQMQLPENADVIAELITGMADIIPASVLHRVPEIPVVLEVTSTISHEFSTRFHRLDRSISVFKLSTAVIGECAIGMGRFVIAPPGRIGVILDPDTRIRGWGEDSTTLEKFMSEEDAFGDPSCFCESDEDPFGCALLCGDGGPLTKVVLTVESETKKMCRTCVKESLEHALANLSGQRPPCLSSLVCGSRKNVPLGAAVMALRGEDADMQNLVQRWLEAVCRHAVRTDDLVVCCPNHPETVIFRETGKCPVPGCMMKVCRHCRQWHPETALCEPEKMKKCPKCHMATFKHSGCNHITCTCGMNWCYECGLGFESGGECYAHMRLAHGGIGLEEIPLNPNPVDLGVV
jgi:hypothetical protein